MDSYDHFHAMRITLTVDLDKDKIKADWNADKEQLEEWFSSWLKEQLDAMQRTNTGLVNFNIEEVEDID